MKFKNRFNLSAPYTVCSGRVGVCVTLRLRLSWDCAALTVRTAPASPENRAPVSKRPSPRDQERHRVENPPAQSIPPKPPKRKNEEKKRGKNGKFPKIKMGKNGGKW
eukprot:6482918-Amphidinium_carterae.1